MLFETESYLDVSRGGGITVARVLGCPDLTGAEAEAVGRQLDELAGDLSGLYLVVDLTGVETLGSLAIAAFLRLDRRIRAARGRLTFVGLSPFARQVLALTHLDTVLDVRPVRASTDR